MPTYYLSDTDIVALTLEQLATSAPAVLDEAQGWVVDKKASPNFCVYKPDTIRPLGDFVTTEPSAFSQLGYRLLATLTGSFAAGNWVLAFKVKCNAYYAQTGYVKFRLWRSVNADGSGATQITPDWQTSTLISFTAGAQYKTGTITWAAGSPVTLSGEYLFLEIEWAAVASGGNNTANVKWVHNEGVAEKLDTPAWTPATQTISGVGNVASGEALGSPEVLPGAVSLQPASIGTGEALGTLKIILFLLAAGIASLEGFGTTKLVRSLQPSSIVSAESCGSPTVRSTNTLLPTGIGSAEAFGTGRITQIIQPSGMVSAETFGTPEITIGGSTQQVQPGGISSTEALGDPAVLPGPVTLQPNGIIGAEVIGTPLILPGAVTLSPAGIPSQETLGTSAVVPGPVTLQLVGIGSAEAFGIAAVLPGAVSLQPSGIASEEAAGPPIILPGAVAVQPPGILSGESFGTLLILPGEAVLQPSGIVSAEALGVPLTLPGAVSLLSESIEGAEAFGNPGITLGGGTWTFPTEPIAINARITFGAAWNVVDLGTNNDVPAGTKGVILRIRNPNEAAELKACTRPKNNTEDRSNASRLWVNANSQKCLPAKLDANRKFEGYFQTSDLDVRVMAYTDEDLFFQNSVDKSLTSTGSYIDCNVSGDGVPGGAQGVLLEFCNTAVGARRVAVRENGITYDVYKYIRMTGNLLAVCGLDGSGFFEQEIEDVGMDCFLWAYLGSNAEFIASPPNKAPGTTGSWQDVDCSANVPVGAIGVILQAVGGVGNYQIGLRKKGAAEDFTTGLKVNNLFQIWAMVGVDESRKFQAYLGGAGPALYLVGYIIGTQTISGAGGIGSGESFGAPGIIPGAVSLQPSGIASAESWGAPAVLPGAVHIQPGGIGSAEGFGAPQLLPGGVTIGPAGIASGEAFGSPTIEAGAVTLKPTGIFSQETFGDPRILPGAVRIHPWGIDSAEAFGLPRLYAIPREIRCVPQLSRFWAKVAASQIKAATQTSHLEAKTATWKCKAAMQTSRLEVECDE